MNFAFVTKNKAPRHDIVEDELGDFTTDRSVLKISLIAFFIGCFSAFVAYVLLRLIAFFTNLAFFGRFSLADVTPQESHVGPWIILIPAIGGLLIGLMARYGSEKIRGHGIPEALEAILIGRSKIDAKVALLKPLSSAISIGTGGPFGAEGPIIMTGGACGSLCAQFFHLSSAERKTLLVAGAAAGMAAVFGTPIAAVLLAVELLLFEWKPRSLVPVAVASIAAAALRVPLLGQGPIFPVTAHTAFGAEGLALACGIGLIAGLGSGALTGLVYAFEDLFPKVKLHWMWWPTIGGLLVGIGGYFDPRVLGVGYGLIHDLLNGQIIGVAALTLLLAKAFVWSASLGSGTSGGVLAPLLMMGGALGVVIGQWLPVGTPGTWAAIGMAAMMGGTMRSPFTAVVFTLELTNDIQMAPALFIATIASEVVTVLLLKRSILTEKVARRGHHITREYVVDPFEIHRVREIMIREFPTLDCDSPLSVLTGSDSALNTWLQDRRALALLDNSDRLVGLLTLGDLMRALDSPDADQMTVLEAGTTEMLSVTDDDRLQDAVFKMLKAGISQLPVVSATDHERVVGFVDRASVMSARMKWYEEEHTRERNLGFRKLRHTRSA
jgi:H+/Cl- antiporter ClcA/CBS domain-containing protein